MSRPNLGPRLTLVRKSGYTRPVYVIRWTEPGSGRSRDKSTGEHDARAAQAAFEDWLERRRRSRRSGPGDPAQVRVADILTDYLEEHGAAVASPQTLAYSIEPLAAFFAPDTMATLTTGRIKAYWTWRRQWSVKTTRDKATGQVVKKETVKRGASSDGTIIRELAGTLRPAIEHAIKQRRLRQGEYYVPVPSAPPGRDYWITRPEAAALVRETRRDPRARLHLPLYALLALYTGQRRGAILDLTWQQVDLVRGRIDFNPPGRRQTKKKRPIIPVPRSLLAALRRAHKRASSPFVIAYRGEKLASVRTGFDSAAGRAGIPDCTSHVLRHTCATWMAQRGVPLREIAGYIGHSETRTTELYSHHHPDFMRQARSALESHD
jgi:integrase